MSIGRRRGVLGELEDQNVTEGSQPQPSDVLVMGGGLAGLAAACRAAELGLSVTLLEKGSDEKYPCNTRWTGGAFHFAFRDVTMGEDRLRAAAEELGIDPYKNARAAALIAESARAVRWLQGQGARFIRAGQYEYQNWLLAPPRRQQAGNDWEGRGGDVLLRSLEAKLRSLGGAFRRGVRAQRLLMSDGICTGVAAMEQGGERRYPARATILADGGFQGSADMLRQYVTRAPERLQQRNAGSAAGDGLNMAKEAGALIAGVEPGKTPFYGHLLSAEALEKPGLSPFPFLDSIATAGIVVNAQGQRFTDEGMGGVYVANQLAQLDDPASAFAIFDEAIWQGPAAERNVPPNPHLIKGGASIVTASTLDALANALRLPADVLARTVSDYNDAIGRGAPLSPARSAHKIKPMPIGTAPFHAVRLCAGITYTMGGIAINERSQVLNANGAPIAGLFAAGGATGGLEGGPAFVYLGGLVAATVTALLAAEYAARLQGKL